MRKKELRNTETERNDMSKSQEKMFYRIDQKVEQIKSSIDSISLQDHQRKMCKSRTMSIYSFPFVIHLNSFF